MAQRAKRVGRYKLRGVTREQFEAWRKAGKTLQAIAAMFGVSAPAVCQKMKRMRAKGKISKVEEIECAYCGEIFQCFRSKKGKFCSPECFHAQRERDGNGTKRPVMQERERQARAIIRKHWGRIGDAQQIVELGAGTGAVVLENLLVAESATIARRVLQGRVKNKGVMWRGSDCHCERCHGAIGVGWEPQRPTVLTAIVDEEEDE